MPILSHCDGHQFRSIGNSNQDFLSGARNSIHEQRVHGAERNEGGEGVFHGLNCKLCDSPIRGERYVRKPGPKKIFHNFDLSFSDALIVHISIYVHRAFRSCPTNILDMFL